MSLAGILALYRLHNKRWRWSWHRVGISWLVTNDKNGQVVEIDPQAGRQIYARWADANKAQSPPDLFDFAMAPSGDAFYYVEDEVNMLVLAH
jgi:hypothetical protein